jgi:phage terminase large subunit-like protein
VSATILVSRVNARARAELARRERMVAMKEDAEDDLLAYVRMMWPVLEPMQPLVEGWVLDLLCDVLMAITDKQIIPPRVSINVPPGSTKSTLLNVLWPSWEWGPRNMPSTRYLSASYSSDVPIRDNLRFATVIKHPVYQQCWGDRVKVTRDGAEWVQNDRTGWKMVTSVSGGTTGFRGDRLLLDDLNNPQTVESDTVRRTTIRFIREIMPDRLNNLDESAIINLQQRTHQNDATGTILEHGVGYTNVCVPMRFDPLRIFPVVLRRDDDYNPVDVWIDPRSLDADGNQLPGLTTNDRGEPAVIPGSPMDRATGESCWPERFSEGALIALEKEKGAYAWNSQYQQYPGVRGGSIIRRDWWKLWKDDDYPDVGTVVVGLDTAVETKEVNDYTALTVWGAFEGPSGEPLMMLMWAWRDRLPLAEIVRQVFEICSGRAELRGAGRKASPKADYLLIEDKTQGRAVHDELLTLQGRNPWQTEMVKPRGDKIARLTAVSHLFSGDATRIPDGKDANGKDKFLDVFHGGGMIYAPDKDWAQAVIDEVADFPYSAHDDWTDTVSMVLGWVRQNGVVLRREEWDDLQYERNVYRKPLTVPYSIKRSG